MSKDFNFKVRQKNQNTGGIDATFDLTTGEEVVSQDITAYQELAKKDREWQEYNGHRKDGYRKFATIPDVLAVKIKHEHGLDLFDPTFLHDPDKVAKLKAILVSEYRDLVINT